MDYLPAMVYMSVMSYLQSKEPHPRIRVDSLKKSFISCVLEMLILKESKVLAGMYLFKNIC